MTMVAFKSLGNRSFRLRVVSLTAHVLASHIDVSLKQYIATDCNKGYQTTAKLLLQESENSDYFSLFERE